jgi:hypothetical protein
MRTPSAPVIPLWLALLWLWGLLLAAAPLRAEEPLARAVLVRGEVTRIDAAGTRKPLNKEDPVRVGDTIETGVRGLAQIVFPDQSILYVQADSRLRIEAFHFEAAAPAQDRSITELLKGSMRAVTGVLGGRSPDQVEVRGGVTTIGIRGTALELAEAASGRWRVTFDYGHGWAATVAGRTDIEAGESVQVASGKRPVPFRYRRLPGDPVELARTLVDQPPAAALVWMQAQAPGLAQEELFFTVGLLREVPGFTPAHLHGVLAGAARGLPGERRNELAGFAVRVYPQEARQLLHTLAGERADLLPVLAALLRGLEGAPPSLLEELFRQALALGITQAEAEALRRELQAHPLPCD